MYVYIHTYIRIHCGVEVTESSTNKQNIIMINGWRRFPEDAMLEIVFEGPPYSIRVRWLQNRNEGSVLTGLETSEGAGTVNESGSTLFPAPRLITHQRSHHTDTRILRRTAPGLSPAKLAMRPADLPATQCGWPRPPCASSSCPPPVAHACQTSSARTQAAKQAKNTQTTKLVGECLARAIRTAKSTFVTRCAYTRNNKGGS
jgi:hypothetical protein